MRHVDSVGALFFTVPVMEAWKLDAPEYLKGATIRITDIQPTGHVIVYSTPKYWEVARFDAEHPEHRLPADQPWVWIQKMEGAESFKAELVAFEPDPEAERIANEAPKVLNFGGTQGPGPADW